MTKEIKHNGDVKPTKVGVYRRDNPFASNGKSYSKWNGEFWCSYCSDRSGAYSYNTKSSEQDWTWYEEVPQFEKMKFHITNPEVSKAVQKKLFEMGYYWSFDRTKVQYADEPYLYTNEEGILSYGGRREYFDSHKNKEMIVEVFTTLTIDFKAKPEETVEFNGKKYNKQKLEEALKAIEQL